MEQRIVVLLSAYNGAEYIEEQIESILNQSHNNLKLIIRDDGSTDETIKILKQYEKYDNISVIYGKNKGFIKSFFELIENAPDAEYYAFADQDDIWYKDKLKMAVEKLSQHNQSEPVLYFSDYNIVDEHRVNQEIHRTISKPSFHNSVADCMTLGFNSVFNRTACRLVKKNIPNHSCGHDWWMYMICAGLGKVIHDKRITVDYRRHSNNVSAGGMSFIKFQLWRFKKFFKNNYFENVRKQLNEFYYLYADMLKPDDKKLLSYFVYDRYNIKKMLCKLFYGRMFRQNLIDELMLRFIFVTGKL